MPINYSAGSIKIISPIPDQIVEASREYRYSLNDVFSGEYTFLHAAFEGETGLTGWLYLEYEEVGSYTAANTINAVAIENGMLYLAMNGIIETVNITDPYSPLPLASYTVSGTTRAMAVQNDLLYTIGEYSGMRVYRMNETTANLLGSYGGSWYRGSIAIGDETLYIKDDWQVEAINVTDPQQMSSLGYAYSRGCDFGGIDCGSGLAEQDGVVIYPGNWGDIQIVNMSIPASPREITQFRLNPIGYGGTSGLAMLEDTLFAMESDNLGTYLHLVNMSDFNQPFILGTNILPFAAGSQLAISKEKAVISKGEEAKIIDLSKASLVGTPRKSRVGETFTVDIFAIDSHNLGKEYFSLVVDSIPYRTGGKIGVQSVFPGEGFHLMLDSDLLFKDPNNDFLSLSLSVSGNTTISGLSLQLRPVLLSTIGDDLGNLIGIKDQIIYVGEQRIIDASNPANPLLLSRYETRGTASSGVDVEGNTMYVADGLTGGSGSPGQFSIFNITDLHNIQPIRFHLFPGFAQDVKVDNSIAFVSDHFGKVVIYDVRNPIDPVQLASIGTGGNVASIDVHDGKLYVTTNRLQIFNVSNPAEPVLLGSLPGVGGDIVVKNTTAFMAGGGLKLVDVNNATSPVLMKQFTIGGSDLAVLGSTAFMVNGNGLVITDTNLPSDNAALAEYTIPGGPNGVAAEGNIVAVCTYSSSMHIFDISQWELVANPDMSEAGNYQAELVATNEQGASASQQFLIRVEGRPKFQTNVPQLYAKVGQQFNYFIPRELVIDPNNDVIQFSAKSSEDTPLPSWLGLNPVDASFSGTPLSQHLGNHTFLLSATDNIAGTATTTFSIYVDHVPVIYHPLDTVVVPIGIPFDYTLPGDLIVDIDGDKLSYDLHYPSGEGSPTWLRFDVQTLQFSGFPNVTHQGTYELLLQASDPYNGLAQMPFDLIVEHAPHVNHNLAKQVAGVNHAYQAQLPLDTFGDNDGDLLSYSVIYLNDTRFPHWLHTSAQLQLSGTPRALNLGDHTFEVIAADPYGATASVTFTLQIVHFPEVAYPIPLPEIGKSGQSFNFQVPLQTFVDQDDVSLSYDALLANGDVLPSWLTFHEENQTFVGRPMVGDEGRWDISVIAQDTVGGMAMAPVTFVIQPDYPPEVIQFIPMQVAVVNEAFSFHIPKDTFVDRNADSLVYELEQTNEEPLPHWLMFNADTLQLHGRPGRSDTNYFSDKTTPVQLTSSDGTSRISTVFDIRVTGNSHLGLFIKVAAPLFTLVGLAYGAYKRRAVVMNACCRDVPRRQEIRCGETWSYTLTTSVEDVANVMVNRPKRANRCSFFRSSYQSLPSGQPLPYWLEYDEHKNILRTKAHQQLPDGVAGIYRIEIRNAAGRITETLELQVTSPALELSPRTADGASDNIDAPRIAC